MEISKTFLLKIRSYGVPLVILGYALLSLHYLSSFYPVGSLEAKLFLSKKASVIEWEKFRLGAKQPLQELVESDSFLNYAEAPVTLVKSPKSKPSLYIRGEEGLYPLMAQPKTGSVPYALIRALSLLVSPSFALMFFTWLCSMVSFVFSLLYVRASSGKFGLYALFAFLTPQIAFFIGPSFPDFHLATACVFAILYFFETARTEKHSIFLGFLLVFCLYTKLSTVMVMPVFLLFFPKKIWAHKFSLLKGFVPGLVVLVLLISSYSYDQVVTQDRMFFKDLAVFWNFWWGGVEYFFYYLLQPSLLFSQVIDNVKPLMETLLSQSVFSHLSLAYLALFILVSFFLFLSGKNQTKLVLAFIIIVSGAMGVSQGYSEDLFVYFSFITYLLLVLFFSLMKPRPSLPRKAWAMALVLFLLLKGWDFYQWNQSFRKMTANLNGCLWTYQCMWKDWKEKDLLQGKPLVTLFYLDVGQLEFFSQETFFPVHVTWKYMKKPSAEEFEDFLVDFPQDTFYSLWSEGRDVSTFMGGTLESASQKLRARGMRWELVKSYDYPELYRSYQLVKFTREKP